MSGEWKQLNHFDKEELDMKILEQALAERAELQRQLELLDKVIAILSPQPEESAPRRRRRARTVTPEGRAKMRAAWARRKAKKAAAAQSPAEGSLQ